jgi:hypothetical protein
MPRSDREIQDLNSDFHNEETWHDIPANWLRGREENQSRCSYNITICPECNSHYICYDDHRDQYTCRNCGLVLS